MPKIHLAWFGGAGPHNWKYPTNALYDPFQADIYLDIARLCERAKFDMIFFPDEQAVATDFGGTTEYSVRNGQKLFLDPLPTLALMIGATRHVGLTATMSTSFYPPYLLARLAATMDHLSNGRFGWNVVTSTNRAEALNYGMADLPEHDERYDIADEYLALCRALWRSWEPDSLIRDRESKIFADPSKVHAANFSGKYFKSTGPLNVPPSPQREPVIIMAGTSPRGQRFAAENAEMAIAQQNDVKSMRTISDKIRAQVSDAGRDPKSCKIFFSIKPVIGDTESIAEEMWQEHIRNSPIEDGLSTLSKSISTDLSKFDLDKPLSESELFDKTYGNHSRLTKLTANGQTLRELAKLAGMNETLPIYGTPEHVADIIEQTAKDAGADGFHFRHRFQDYNYLLDICTKLIPIMQKRDLVRKEYTGTTLRHHLNEF